VASWQGPIIHALTSARRHQVVREIGLQTTRAHRRDNRGNLLPPYAEEAEEDLGAHGTSTKAWSAPSSALGASTLRPVLPRRLGLVVARWARGKGVRGWPAYSTRVSQAACFVNSVL
jgi:hypothetical protein